MTNKEKYFLVKQAGLQKNILKGLLAGTAVGGAGALGYKGWQTMDEYQSLAQQGSTALDEANKQLSDMLTNTEDQLTEGLSGLETLPDDIMEEVEGGMTSVEEGVGTLLGEASRLRKQMSRGLTTAEAAAALGGLGALGGGAYLFSQADDDDDDEEEEDGSDPNRWKYHGTGDGSDVENWKYSEKKI